MTCDLVVARHVPICLVAAHKLQAELIYSKDAECLSRKRKVLSCCCRIDAGQVFVTGPITRVAQVRSMHRQSRIMKTKQCTNL